MEDDDILKQSSITKYFKHSQQSAFDDISELQQVQDSPMNSDVKSVESFIETDFNKESIQEVFHNPNDVVHDQSKVESINNSSSSFFSSANSQYNFISYPSATEDNSFDDSIADTYLRSGQSGDLTCDAWLPSEKTKEILSNVVSSPVGTVSSDKFNLTMPGIAVKEEFGDPVRNLVQTYLGEEAAVKRSSMTFSSVTQDDRGLRKLILSGCYHAAVNLTTQLLTVYGQGEGKAGQPSKHTAHSIQLWFTRLALLVKLRRFSLAEVECESLGDLDGPDLYFEYYPQLYGGRKGSMVPFSFRMLVAILPQYLGKHLQALDRLSKILSVCEQILVNLNNGLCEDGTASTSSSSKEIALKVWKAHKVKVLYALTNCAVSFKDLRLANSLLNALLQEEPGSSADFYAALGRLYLHLGDTESAQEAFKKHLEYSPKHDHVQGLLHSALICCAKSDFQGAVQIFNQTYKISPANPLVVNNLAVCLMFVGKIRDAINLVETELFSNPEKFLHEALILNLSTMYELESSNAHSKKLNILSLISAHMGDGFNIGALKLQVN